MSLDDDFEEMLSLEWEPYVVECACCGKFLLSNEAVAEEGDRWECFKCWEICEAKERNNEPPR